VIGGRRGGKDSVASLITAHSAALFDGKRRQVAGIQLPALRRGERATIFTLAKDRDQARIALDYVRSYFQESRIHSRAWKLGRGERVYYRPKTTAGLYRAVIAPDGAPERPYT
jgi:hypothetical protein